MSKVKIFVFKLLTIYGERRLLCAIYTIWNLFLLKLGGAKIGRNCKIRNRTFFSEPQGLKGICIGDNFTMSSGGGLNPLARGMKSHIHVANNARLVIGNNVGISSSVIWCSEEVKIGNNTIIGALSSIIDTDAHPLDAKQRLYDLGAGAKSQPIHIGESVFIGTQCLILKGVSIGDRAVVAAGAVVTKDVPADCIVGGNPAKILKRLN